MLQPCHVALLGLQIAGDPFRPVLDDTLRALDDLELHIKAYSESP